MTVNKSVKNLEAFMNKQLSWKEIIQTKYYFKNYLISCNENIEDQLQANLIKLDKVFKGLLQKDLYQEALQVRAVLI